MSENLERAGGAADYNLPAARFGSGPSKGFSLADSVRELLGRDAPDGSCFAEIQAMADPALPHYADRISSLATGCAVEVTGDLVESSGKGP